MQYKTSSSPIGSSQGKKSTACRDTQMGSSPSSLSSDSSPASDTSPSSFRDWSCLPKDILFLILDRLGPEVHHHLRLRAVCTTWRSALPLPLDRLFRHIDRRRYVRHFHEPKRCRSIVKKTYLLVSRPNQPNWLIHVEETRYKKWRFFNPINGSRLQLPPELVSSPVNLMECQITELGKSLNFESDDSQPTLFRSVKRLISSSDMEESAVLMALSNEGKLGFWQSGFDQWLHLTAGDGRIFADIIHFNDRFYAVDTKGRLVVIEASAWTESLNHVTDIVELPLVHGSAELYLIVSQGSLYLLLKTTSIVMDKLYWRGITEEKTVSMYVLKEEGGEGKWNKVSSLGDQVFFVGGVASFAVSSEVLGWKTNSCVYKGWLTDQGSDVIQWHRLSTWGYLTSVQSYFYVGEIDACGSVFLPPTSWIK